MRRVLLGFILALAAWPAFAQMQAATLGGYAPLPPENLSPSLLAENCSVINGSGQLTLSTNNVTTWTCANGAAIAQATGSLQPLYSATGFNGSSPGVTFDGVDDNLALVGVPAGWPTGTTAGEVIVLARLDSTPGGAAEAFAYGSGASGADRRVRSAAASPYTISTGPITRTLNPPSVAPVTMLWGMRFIDDTHIQMAVWDRLTDIMEGTSSSTATTRLRIASSATAGTANFFPGTYKAIIVTKALDDIAHRRLMAYLMANAR